VRVELPEGQWAELREELTHGQTKRLQRALFRASENPAEAAPDIDTEFVAVYVAAWSLRGVGDVPPDLDARLPVIDSLPEPVVSAIALAAAKVWKGRADPNASTASSESGPPAAA
jgi:hypothetical protein